MTVSVMADEGDIDIRINHADWEGWPVDLSSQVKTVIGAATKHTASGRFDLLLTGDEEIQSLNSQWRSKDKPTDVLSFPSDEDPSNPDFIGDIVISHGVLGRDAAKMGKTPEAHFSHLLVHGFLHLLGYDHMTDEEAEEMEGLEIKILAELGITDPYSAGTAE